MLSRIRAGLEHGLDARSSIGERWTAKARSMRAFHRPLVGRQDRADLHNQLMVRKVT